MLAHAAPFKLDENVVRQILQFFANAFKRAGDAALHKAAGLAKAHAEHAVHFALPLAQRKLAQQIAGGKANLKVVHPKISGVGVRHIHGHQGNIRFGEDMRHVRRHVLLHLELKHKVHALADKFTRVLDGDVGVLLVVEHHQFNAGCGRRGGHAIHNGDGEGHFSGLRGQAKTQPPRARDQPVLPALRLRHVAAVHQGFQNAIDAGLGNLCLLEDIFQSDRRIGLLQ